MKMARAELAESLRRGDPIDTLAAPRAAPTTAGCSRFRPP